MAHAGTVGNLKTGMGYTVMIAIVVDTFHDLHALPTLRRRSAQSREFLPYMRQQNLSGGGTNRVVAPGSGTRRYSIRTTG